MSEKHAIRKQLHPQLKELWNSEALRPFLGPLDPVAGRQYLDGIVARLAARFSRGHIGYVPLVTCSSQLFCHLDILFLRREGPSGLVSGGDIDNRLKTLFDALRMPKDTSEVPGGAAESENPFYCLLEDDSLIAEVSVRTGRLLKPIPDGGDASDVVLILNADIKSASSGFIVTNLLNTSG